MEREYSQASKDYGRIEKMLRHLNTVKTDQPKVDELARAAGLSAFHFQKVFKRWVGLSPKQFLDLLSIETAKELLEKSEPILESSLEVGLSSPSRLHDLFIKVEAMTPGEYKNCGKGIDVSYGFHATPFGLCMIATTKRGICGLDFVKPSDKTSSIEFLKQRWPLATIKRDDAKTDKFVHYIFGRNKKSEPLPVFMKGTAFQIKVWQALINIPKGAVISYEQVARLIHSPKAYRAVATAIASNPIGYIIPCHRVIRAMGHFGQYRWGKERKQAILAFEQSV